MTYMSSNTSETRALERIAAALEGINAKLDIITESYGGHTGVCTLDARELMKEETDCRIGQIELQRRVDEGER